MSEPEKKKPLDAIVGIALVTTGIILCIWVTFIVVRALLPGVFTEFNGTLGVLSQGFTDGSVRLQQTGITLGMWMTGWLSVFIRVMLYVLLFAVSIYFFRLGMSKLRGGGGHAPAPAAGGHHP